MTDLQPIWRVNRRPRFTALEMGEYMAADDGPRETILRNMKYERLARSLSYRNVSEAVASFLASPIRDHRILGRCRQTLEEERHAATNPQRRENLNHELRALDAFERSLNALEASGFQMVRVPSGHHPLRIERVAISVQPTVGIRVRRLRGSDLAGALIIDVAKGQSPKTPEAQARASAAMVHSAILLHRFVVEAMCPDGAKPSPDHCIVFHSYRGERACAPSNYKKILRNIEAVCRNIAKSWDDVAPPATFNAGCARYRN